ncbi:MAG: PLP-dependent transferase [Eubacteriales bacterium]|nr:PLP-dependent transferase [Eubacteriales bacterium]
MEELYQKLKDYCTGDAYPFHMPGHKRRMGVLGDPFAIDITEIDGFDNLHHAEGLLREAQNRAAKLYGADETYYLVNGSTCGILAAVFACTTQGGKILMARNCHKAAYHAAELRGLRTAYLYPDIIPCGTAAGILEIPQRIEKCYDTGRAVLNSAISPQEVERMLARDPEIEVVLITSPTYDGIVSDVGAIAEAAHRYGVPLIVDEAHGAHFGFHPYFPESALQQGADIVIHSLHKTLPSLTQTALLHVMQRGYEDLRCAGQSQDNAGESNGSQGLCTLRKRQMCVDCAKVHKYLGMFETSSPSYVLMAGMDRCVQMMADHGTSLFEAFADRLEKFYGEMEKWQHVHVVTKTEIMTKGRATVPFDFDRSKVIITADIMSGVEIAEFLRREHQLEVEMAAGDYALALTSVCDDEEGFRRLYRALRELDMRCEKSAVGYEANMSVEVVSKPDVYTGAEAECHIMMSRAFWEEERNPQVYTIAQAAELHGHSIPVEDCAGKVSLEYVYLYPPGIPLIVPGERICEDTLLSLLEYRKRGLELQGMKDMSGDRLIVY